jgi:tRNA G18 (ribose-2'-O)-methylase SpoU
MVEVRAIDSLDLPELGPYRTLKRQVDHRKQRIFVAEGEKIVRRLLASEFIVVSVLVTEEWFRTLEPPLNERSEVIQAYVAPKSLLEKIVGFKLFQGIMAVGKIPVPATFDGILQESSSPRLLVALDGVTNSENLGVLVRNCAAFAVQALIVGETSSSPYLRRAVRNSMGAIFRLPVLETPNLVQTLSDLRKRNVRCIAAHPGASKQTLSAIPLTGDCCLVFGNEGYGIAERTLRLCDDLVAIPMSSAVDSLNIGSAAAVFLYEVNRQRRKV